MIFIENKYTSTYSSIVNKAKNENRKKHNGVYYESHHIIPKCLGGTNDRTNLVLLTAREHFICHLLLTKMVTGQAQIKMNIAMTNFLRTSKTHNRDYNVTSRFYKYIREKCAKAQSGSRNPMYGKTHSEETRRKMSEKVRAYNNNNPPRKHTEEYKRKMSEAKMGKKHSEESRRKMSDSQKQYFKTHPGRDNNSDKTWYTNGTENKLLFTCPDGFVEGRISDNVYKFIDPDGNVRECNSLVMLGKEIGVTKSMMSKLHSGKIPQCKGWRKYDESIVGCAFNETDFHKFFFTDPDGNIVSAMRIKDICEKYSDVKSNGLSLVWNGNIDQYKGWKRHLGAFS